MRGEERGGERPTRSCGRTRGIQRKLARENIPNFCAWTENNRNASRQMRVTCMPAMRARPLMTHTSPCA
eukprot:1564359-Prymnesium_polylepis.1